MSFAPSFSPGAVLGVSDPGLSKQALHDPTHQGLNHMLYAALESQAVVLGSGQLRTTLRCLLGV